MGFQQISIGDAMRRRKVVEICEALPEVVAEDDHHVTFRIRKKTFAYYLDNHHHDGVVGLVCKSTHDRQEQLVGDDPERYYLPAYMAHQGWVGFRLDLPDVDWDVAADLIHAAYRLQAPKKLAEQVRP